MCVSVIAADSIKIFVKIFSIKLKSNFVVCNNKSTLKDEKEKRKSHEDLFLGDPMP